MAFSKVIGRGVATLGFFALVACQTPPQGADPVQTQPEAPDTAQQPDAALVPGEPAQPSGAAPTAREQEVEYSPLMVFLADLDRKSTRLNSSHVAISYAVFCLKKKKKKKNELRTTSGHTK